MHAWVLKVIPIYTIQGIQYAITLCVQFALNMHMLFYSRSSSVTAEIVELGPAPALVLA